MPLLDSSQRFQEGLPGAIPEPLPERDLSALDVLAAGFRQGNIVSAFMERITGPARPDGVEPDYDPLNDIAGFEDYAKKFVRSESRAETQWIKQRITEEEHDRGLLAEAGGWGFAAALGAGVVDPATLGSMFLPVAAPVAFGTRLQRIMAGVKAQAAVDTGFEVGMHGMQETRTLRESAINVGAGTLLTGAFGSIAVRMPKAEFEQAARTVAEEIAPRPGAPSLRALDPTPGEVKPAKGLDELRQMAWRVKSTMNKTKSVDFNNAAEVSKATGEKAESIAAFVKRTGGIRDEGGELAARDVTGKTAPGLVRKNRYNKAGEDSSMDAVRERVFAAGYFPDRTDYNAISDSELWDVIADDVTGNRFWQGTIRSKIEAMRPDQRALDDLAMDGITPDMSIEDIAARLQEAQAGEMVMRAQDEAEVRDFLREYEGGGSIEDVYINPTGESTAGAMRVAGTTLEDESIAKGGLTIAATVGRINPVLRVLRSPFVESRRLVQELVPVTFMLNKNKRGVPTAESVEVRSNRKITRARIAIANEVQEAFSAYRKRVGPAAVKMREFGQEVSRAMRRGDASDIQEAVKVATFTRKIFDADREAAQAVGALPAEIKLVGAESYFPRVWDHRAIVRSRAAFEEVIYRWYSRTSQGQEPAEILAAVQETYDTVMGTRRGLADVGSDEPGVAGPLKERLLSVPDELLEPFMVNDFEHVMNGYLRSVVPQIEMRRAFDSIDLKAELDGIHEAARVKIAAAKSNEAKEKLRQQALADERDLMGMRDRILGQVGPRGDEARMWVTAGRIVRSYNYVRMLGNQTLSSLSDAGRMVARYGLVRTGAATAKFLGNLHANKLVREDAKRMGTAVQWTIDTRGATLAEIGDDLPGSRIEQLAQHATQRFTRISGMATWNSSLQAITSILQQDQIIRAARRGIGTDFERGRLAQYGIGDEELARILGQFDKFGEEVEGMLRARTDLWNDRVAARLLEDAVVQSADVVVLQKSAGDLPLLMDSEIFKTLLQFKSFGMSSVTRTMVPMGQGFAHGDLATINGAAVMLGLGGLSYYLRELAAGREPDLSPMRVAAESLNWSGLMGYIPDVWDPVSAHFHGPRFSRFTGRTPITSAAGPTFGSATDVSQTIIGMTDGDVSASNIHQLRQLVPLQNVFWLRRVINGLEGELAEGVGAEGATGEGFLERVIETRPVE